MLLKNHNTRGGTELKYECNEREKIMEKITSKQDNVYVLKNFLEDKECDKYYNMINNIGYQPSNVEWEDRTLDITEDLITTKVKKYLNKKFDLNLKEQQTQIQNHHVNSALGMHVHNDPYRGSVKYNSLIYLNDDFDGGEFVTRSGIKIKPEKGMLTFFNSQTVWHGVNKVLKKDRKTIIFWWWD